jgi:Fe-S cluster assembly protein SufD
MSSISCMQPFQASFETDFVQDAETHKKMREKCWQRFVELGLPKRSHENFQFMKLHELESSQYVQAKNTQSPSIELQGATRVVFVNGYFRADLSDITALPKGCVLMSLNQAFKSYSVLLNNRYNKQVLEDVDAFALLNAAKHQEGAFLYLPPKLAIASAIEIISVIDSEDAHAWIQPRLHMFVAKHTEVEVIATTQFVRGDSSFYNAVYDFELEDEAKLLFTHADLAGASTHSYRFDAFRATLKRNSSFKAIQLTDSEKSRRDWKVLLAGEAASADLSGLWFLDGNKETHTNVSIEHQEPHTTSLQLFKGILDDESLSSFQGQILVRKKAQKTQAYQLNNNLVLSNKASANSKPNLEIFADDVKASHGATVGQLDQEQLFYLKSRGMDVKLARGLLIRGFCEQVINKVKHPLIRRLAEQHLASRYNIVVR